MSFRPRAKATDPGVAQLRLEMSLRNWSNADLAKALGVSVKTVDNNFANEFSSAGMRAKVQQMVNPEIFKEESAKGR